jgi:hypothetical protein
MSARPVAAAGRPVSSRRFGALLAVLVALLLAWLGLTVATGDLRVSQDGSMIVNVLVFGAVGLVVARRQPRNPIGWILVGVSLVLLFNLDTKLYSVLDYRIHRGGLPLGRAALAFSTFGVAAIVLGMLAVLLFPDGGLQGRWRRAVWIYVGIGTLFLLGQVLGEATLHLGRHVEVDARGKLPAAMDQTGWWGASFLLLPFLLGFWIAFIVRQIRSWRRAGGVQREQLKWLMSGAVLTLLGTLVFLGTASATGAVRIVAAIAALTIGSFPIAIGVGILRYRLYEIDRLISRTISYALLTAALAGVFVAVVVLTTRVLPLSSPVGVAASTLATAALFTPLRGRLQRLIDRRFNRARYDAEAILAAFTGRLRDEVEVDAIRDQLLRTTSATLAPAHASIWIRPSS